VPPSWIVATPEGVVIRVHAQPGAARSRIVGTHGDALKIQVRARPVEGAANRALVDLLAEALAVRAAAVTVVAGARGREKRLAVSGIDVAAACARLAPFVDKGGTPD
jgi:uncharacterized protein (TIGR00251 family)